jgi:hypothetical protein
MLNKQTKNRNTNKDGNQWNWQLAARVYVRAWPRARVCACVLFRFVLVLLCCISVRASEAQSMRACIFTKRRWGPLLRLLHGPAFAWVGWCPVSFLPRLPAHCVFLSLTIPYSIFPFFSFRVLVSMLVAVFCFFVSYFFFFLKNVGVSLCFSIDIFSVLVLFLSVFLLSCFVFFVLLFLFLFLVLSLHFWLSAF